MEIFGKLENMLNQSSTSTLSTQINSSPLTLAVAPAKIIRGAGILTAAVTEIARLGNRPLIVSGDCTLVTSRDSLQSIYQSTQLHIASASYGVDCCEASLKALRKLSKEHKADLIIGVGGGKALDTAKLIAHQLSLPVVTIPTSAATCAAWTALSNVYSESGAFLYDVALSHCPDLLLLDYNLLQTAPQRTLVAGIGDAIPNGMKPRLAADIQSLL